MLGLAHEFWYKAMLQSMTGLVELEALRRDEEFVLYRSEHSDQPGLQSVLFLTPASMQPALGSIKKIEHEYSLRDELDSSWAVRPLALSDQPGQMTLVLEDRGDETLDRLLPGPMSWRSSCASRSVSQPPLVGCTRSG